MIYWLIAMALGTFLLGYLWGLDRGFRKAHTRIVSQQLSRDRIKRKINQADETDVYNPLWVSSSRKSKLRLVKDEDTRE